MNMSMSDVNEILDLIREANVDRVTGALRNPNKAYYIFCSKLQQNQVAEKIEEQRHQVYENEKSYIVPLSRLLNIKKVKYHGYHDEIESSSHIAAQTEEYDFDMGNTAFSVMPFEGRALYSTMRGIEPKNVLEIGLNNGVSSYFILAALSQNSQGTLISAGMPVYEFERSSELLRSQTWIPSGKGVGWVVPKKYHPHWEIKYTEIDQVLQLLDSSHPPLDCVVYNGPAHQHEQKKTITAVIESVNDDCPLIVNNAVWDSMYKQVCKKRPWDYLKWGNLGFFINMEG